MRDEYLATVGRVHDPCGTVRRTPEKVVAPNLGFTGMKATTNHEREASRYGRVVKLRLNRDDGTDAVDWILEDGVNAVAGRFNDSPAMCFDGRSHQPVVRGNGVRHA